MGEIGIFFRSTHTTAASRAPVEGRRLDQPQTRVSCIILHPRAAGGGGGGGGDGTHALRQTASPILVSIPGSNKAKARPPACERACIHLNRS